MLSHTRTSPDVGIFRTSTMRDPSHWVSIRAFFSCFRRLSSCRASSRIGSASLPFSCLRRSSSCRASSRIGSASLPLPCLRRLSSCRSFRSLGFVFARSCRRRSRGVSVFPTPPRRQPTALLCMAVFLLARLPVLLFMAVRPSFLTFITCAFFLRSTPRLPAMDPERPCATEAGRQAGRAVFRMYHTCGTSGTA